MLFQFKFKKIEANRISKKQTWRANHLLSIFCPSIVCKKDFLWYNLATTEYTLRVAWASNARKVMPRTCGGTV